jgi:hypothetical protein
MASRPCRKCYRYHGRRRCVGSDVQCNGDAFAAPKPPRQLAEIQADIAATRAQAIQNCIQTSYNEHSSNALSVKDQTDITKGCADAVGTATDAPAAAVAAMSAEQPAGQAHGTPDPSR